MPGFGFLLGVALATRAARRGVARLVSRRALRDEEIDAYFGPLLRERGVRRDVTRWLRGVSARHTIEAAKRFAGFAGPVLLVWSKDDWLFRLPLGERLARAFPGARLRVIERSRAFVPEDRPDAVIEALRELLEAPAAAPPHDAVE